MSYRQAWSGFDAEADYLTEGLRYATIDDNRYGHVSVDVLAPLEHAREDGTYDPAVIKQWRDQLLAIQ